MGLDDITKDAKEELEQYDDDDLKELEELIEEYIEKVDMLNRVMVNMDKRMESINDDLDTVKVAFKRILNKLDEMEEDEPELNFGGE